MRGESRKKRNVYIGLILVYMEGDLDLEKTGESLHGVSRGLHDGFEGVCMVVLRGCRMHRGDAGCIEGLRASRGLERLRTEDFRAFS